MARFLIVLLVAVAAPLWLAAAPLSRDDAVRRAAEWVARRPEKRACRAAMRPEGVPSGRVRTCSLGGTELFHLVALDGGGFVAIAADDARPAVMGFAQSGELPDADPGNPFWALVGADAAASAGIKRRGGAAAFDVSDGDATAAATRARLAKAAPIRADSALDDVRVPPLVQSKWDQMNLGGRNLYNLYTPHHWYCGCVATALAQIMRFHRHPSSSVSPQTFTCYTNGVPVYLTMRGGVYDWDAMPLVPNSSITDAQREAIGGICYDAGVAMRMFYAPSGSGALALFAGHPLKDVFGFASAQGYGISSGTIADEAIRNAALANLDAGYPVLLGIYGSSAGGHAVIADGYGYADGVLFCHLNMGWSGSWDYWYALPNIPSAYTFTEVSDVVYNIFPDRTGELVTGRVADPFGEPVSNATVVADISYQVGRRTYTLTGSATTSASGLYAIFAPAGRASTVSLSATYGGWVSTNAAVATTRASSSPVNPNFDTGSYDYPSAEGLVIGNSWGNDLFLAPASIGQPAFAGIAPKFGVDGIVLTVSGTPGAAYRVEWTPSLSPATWSECARVLVPAAGIAEVPVSVPEGSPAAFFRIVGGD